MADVEQQPFLRAVGDEFVRLFRRPWLEVGIIAFNTVMVMLGWWLLPLTWRNWLFDNLHGPMAFAIVLETWMLSDVTSTNLLGHDEVGAAEAVENGTVTRLLQVKIITLGLVIAVIAVGAAVVIQLLNRGDTKGLRLLPLLIGMPIGLVAVCSLVGVVFPYRQRSIVWRWRHRERWMMQLRWAVLLLVPYMLVGVLATGFLYPAKKFADAITGWNHQGRPPSSTVTLMAWIVMAQAIVAVLIVPRLASWVASMRRTQLLSRFADPDAG